jgi:hypothetical protein
LATPLYGWGAFKTVRDLSAPAPEGSYQYRFKLRLAWQRERNDFNIPNLPPGKSTQDVITDYMQALSSSALTQISQKIPGGVVMRDIKWCITVPANWGQSARTVMYRAAQLSGMIRPDDGPDNGGSRFPLVIVPEPEAAAVFFLNSSVHPESARQLYVTDACFFMIHHML